MKMKTNDKGLEIIKYYEGLRTTSYYCPSGILTIGYGHTSAAGWPEVKVGMKISEAEAEEILKNDLQKFEEVVSDLVKIKLNSNQFSALVSFVYNIGPSAFKESTLLRLLNSGDFERAANQFKRWNKSGSKVLEGLVKRRNAEEKLFRESGTMSSERNIFVIANQNTLIKIAPRQSAHLSPGQFKNFSEDTVLRGSLKGEVDGHYKIEQMNGEICYVFSGHVTLAEELK
jgi:lysozyme